MGNSLEATDRALEVLDLLDDLLNGRELLRSVTNGVLSLGRIGKLLLSGVGVSRHRGGRLWLGAGAEKRHGAGQ
jgi:hypothetical protein